MTQWATFAGFTSVLLLFVLALARASEELIEAPGEAEQTEREPVDREPSDSPALEPESPGVPEAESEAPGASGTKSELPGDTEPRPREPESETSFTTSEPPRGEPRDRDLAQTVKYGPEPSTAGAEPDASIQSMPTQALLVNVALSQAFIAAGLLVAAWYTSIPAWAFGVTGGAWSTGLPALALGIGFGVVLYVANELGAALGEHVGLGRSEALREALAPDSTRGWALLLLVVLPIVAGFEELLFRGALVGVFHAWLTAAGYALSPWPLAVLSSVAFAMGHGAQGRAGIAVTGVLGFVLAAGFILTDSLLVVFVAHYLVNALEFVVHEGLGIDWT